MSLEVYNKYFQLNILQYLELSHTEKGIVLSLVKHYPEKFLYQDVVTYVRENVEPVGKHNTSTLADEKQRERIKIPSDKSEIYTFMMRTVNQPGFASSNDDSYGFPISGNFMLRDSNRNMQREVNIPIFSKKEFVEDIQERDFTFKSESDGKEDEKGRMFFRMLRKVNQPPEEDLFDE